MGDLFGFLFLFLIEKETVEDATEENRFSACNAIVDHQPHAVLLTKHGPPSCTVLPFQR